MKLKLFTAILFAALLSSACGSSTPAIPTPDVAFARTSAAQTVVAEFTLTAAAFTPTLEPLPTETETPAPVVETPAAVVTDATSGLPVEVSPTVTLCDKYAWDDATVDVNTPDGTEMQAGQQFVKTWKIKNVGSCVWGDGYKLIYAGYSDQMSGQPQPLGGVVAIGQEIEVSVNFKAPAKIGEYVSAWTLVNAKGIPFFGNNNKPLYVKIVVK